MTKNFNTLYESIINEVLSGSKKRNRKTPGMGRKGGKSRDLAHATPMPREVDHPAHLMPYRKSKINNTGAGSKDPTSHPVYMKNGVKPSHNKSQRGFSPYSSNHNRNQTKRNHMDRRRNMISQ